MSGWERILTNVNVFVYRVSNGLLGSKMGGQSMLLLHTIGRRSGKGRTASLAYYRDGSNYLIVASNWGKDNHPGWFHNLMQQPRTSIQVGSRTIAIEAHQAQGEEYQRLWLLVTSQNSQYVEYQKGTKRRIPIVILTPVDMNR